MWKSGICAGKDTGVNSPAGRKGTFDGRYGCRKCFCVTFDKSNKTVVSGESFLNIAMSGINKNYVPWSKCLKGSIHERLAWGARKSEMENQQRKKNKTKNRGMER